MTGGARRGAAVLGFPIEHSLSPVLHRAAYDALGLRDWSYRAVACTEEALLDTLRALEAEGLAGASLTMPLKRAVLPMLTRVERVAADVGGANTVLFGGITGEWWGANTDVPGLVDVLRAAGADRPRTLTVLGSGATAASAVAAAGQLALPQVVVVARRPEAAADVVEVGSRFLVAVEVRPWTAYGDALGADVVVSTVPAGAADALAGAVGRPQGLLFDVIYAPWPTVLAQAWQHAGGPVVGGLELLVAQAAEQVRLMTGQAPPVAAMRAAGEAALAARQAGP
jgi:shikimate dehydrogenase